jgi:acyl carrier protein
MLQLINMLNEEYMIKIRPQDILPENFNSVESMLKLIEKKQKE